jgi:energy-coupling factor transporter ATP-binding protein EcfA2
MARKVSDWMRREAEADVFKLLGRTPQKPKPARDLLEELLGKGVSTRSAARVTCAAESDDPLACARTIPDKPRSSVPRSTAPIFEQPPVWTDRSAPRSASRPSHRLKLKVSPVSFRINASQEWRSADQINSFMLATGGSGSGKSELLKSLAAQLAQQVPVLVFDVHGDLTISGLQSLKLGAQLGINPLNQPSHGESQARDFVESLRLAVPSVGNVQALILSETVRLLCSGDGRYCNLRGLKKGLTERRSSKSSDHASVVGLLASLDGIFGDAVFSAPHALDPSALLHSSHRLFLGELSRSAQILVMDTLLRWLFAKLKAAGPVSSVGALRLFAVVDEAALLKGSEVLERIFREGRKFGFGFALASQLAADFSSAIRANAGTLFALRAGSAREQTANARELGLPAGQVAALAKPGQAVMKDAGGVRRIDVQRWPFATAQSEPASQQLAMGRQIEREHTDDPAIAEKIARDHLREIPDYYTRLEAMEQGAKSGPKPKVSKPNARKSPSTQTSFSEDFLR